MSHDLGIKVTAEGIENKEQYQFLLDHHCDYIQGFLFSKPMPLAELEAFLTYALEQGVAHRPVTLDEVFPPSVQHILKV